MRYKDAACAACGRLFTDEDDVVVCPACGAPHHRECWLKTGKCAMNDAHAEGYVWAFPEDLKPAEPAPAPRQDTPDGPQLSNGEKVIACPKCGSPNFQNDIYCLRCGARLDGQAPDEPQDPYDPDYDGDAERGYYNDIRSDFDRYGGISPDASVDGIPCAEYADFVGGSRPGRIIRKVSTMERYGRKISWNWAALVFGPAWFLWRKMKKEGAIFAMLLVFFAAMMGIVSLDATTVKYYKQIATVPGAVKSGEISLSEMRERMAEYAEAYAEEWQQNASPVRVALQDGLEYCTLAGVPLAAALLGTPLYRRKVKNDILAIRGKCRSMDEYRRALQTEGGTSAAGAIVGVAAMLAALFCALYLPMLIAVFFI